MIRRIIIDLLQAYIVILFVRLICSWFPIDPWSPWAKVVRVLASITDPVLRPFRRLPPIRLGAGAIDISPLAVFVILEIVILILQSH